MKFNLFVENNGDSPFGSVYMLAIWAIVALILIGLAIFMFL